MSSEPQMHAAGTASRRPTPNHHTGGSGYVGANSNQRISRVHLLMFAILFPAVVFSTYLFFHTHHNVIYDPNNKMPGKSHSMSKDLGGNSAALGAVSSGNEADSTDTGDNNQMDAVDYASMEIVYKPLVPKSRRKPQSAVLLSIPDPPSPSSTTSPLTSSSSSSSKTKGGNSHKHKGEETKHVQKEVKVVDKSDRQAVYYMEDDEEEDDDAEESKSSTSKKGKTSSKSNNKQRTSSNNRVSSSNNNHNNKNNQKRKPQRRFAAGVLYNHEPEWGFQGELPYIQVMPTLKIPLKKDRRVVFPNLTFTKPSRDVHEVPSGVLGMPRELTKANQVLQTHPIYGQEQWYDGSNALEDTMAFIQKSPHCYQKPIFLSMATVGDDLYWQLIENFMYTSIKFNVSQCSLVICVSDLNCMKMCESAYFPCYNYQEGVNPLPSVMEQIAKVKLFHVPKALNLGVDVFMLDLDVGFLGDPSIMLKAFYATPIVDIMVQEDYIFIMNRTVVGWKQWFTEPLPNIGLFLCRGNNKTAKVFDIAWEKYKLMDDPWEKAQPGRDQNHVLDGMRIGRGEFGLKYAYFSNTTAPLLDKLVLNYGTVMELGGELMHDFLLTQHAVAMHATCYEKSTKVMGLKAANAFWNPRYYDPLRKTITKQLLFTSELELLDEVRSLIWLAMATERSLIIPNILGPESIKTVAKYQNQSMWPGFRVTFLKRSHGRNELKVNILEPGYYWRVERDYDSTPEAQLVYYDPRTDHLMGLKERIINNDHPRLIIHPMKVSSRRSYGAAEFTQEEEATHVKRWADHSIGIFHQAYSDLIRSYKPIPSVKGIRTMTNALYVNEVLQGMRTCAYIFGPHRGNRTCFQVCD